MTVSLPYPTQNQIVVRIKVQNMGWQWAPPKLGVFRIPHGPACPFTPNAQRKPTYMPGARDSSAQPRPTDLGCCSGISKYLSSC